METVLNLIWLAVTIAALWLWHFRWAVSKRESGRSLRLEAVAMVCVLALLFPVISLTDDLHPEIVPADTVSSKRNHCLLAAHATGSSSTQPPTTHSPVGVMPISTASIELAAS